MFAVMNSNKMTTYKHMTKRKLNFLKVIWVLSGINMSL